MRGVVLGVRGRRALVMAEDGSFRRIRCRYPLHVGQVLELGRPERAPAWVAIPAALSLTAVLFLLFFLPRSLGGPVAYATLDINPSVEFGLGGRGEVRSAQGLDPEGVWVLAGTSVRGVPLSRAVEAVVEQAREEGYVRPGGRIILALAPRRPIPLGGEIEGEFQRAREVAGRWGQREKLRVIGVTSGDPGVREEARKRNLSLGRYLVEKARTPEAPGSGSGSELAPAPRDVRPELPWPGRPDGGAKREERGKHGRMEELVPVLEDEEAAPGERRGDGDREAGARSGIEGGAPGSGEWEASGEGEEGRTGDKRWEKEEKKGDSGEGDGKERKKKSGNGDSGNGRSGSQERRDKEGKGD